jgi:hypothetical protein
MNKEKIISAIAMFTTKGWRWWMPRLLSGAVGLILLTAAISKSTDMGLFIRQIRSYDIISYPVLTGVSAWALVALEFVLGVGLLFFFYPRLFLPITVGLVLFFLGINGWAWLKEGVEDCGCFGAWVKHTPAEAVVINLSLLAASCIAWIGHRPVCVPQSRFKAWVVGFACAIGLALLAVFGFSISQIKGPQPNAVEAKLVRLQIQGLDKIDLKHGSFLIILMDTDCLHCQEAVFEVNILAEEPDLPPVISLFANDEDQRRRFAEEFQPIFPIGQITEDDFWHLLGDGDMPRTILFSDQHVLKVWDEKIPDIDRIKAVNNIL